MKRIVSCLGIYALIVMTAGACIESPGTGIDNGDGTAGSTTGGTPGQYWSRNDGQRTAYLYLSGSTAKACSGGQETLGTFNSSKPSMIFVISGDRLEFPLRFADSSGQATNPSTASSLLVGVPDQGINTNTATWYVRTSTYSCGGSTGGGTGGGSGGGSASVGRVTFWTSRSDGGATTVTLNGQVIGSLNSYFRVAPPCTQTSGTVSVERAPGTYAFSARDEDGRTWSGNVTVAAGNCLTMELQ